MPTFAAEKLATWTGGSWTRLPGGALTGFTQDTRLLAPGQVFVALKTGKRKMESISQSDVQVRMYGTTALVVGNSNVKVVANGNTMEHSVRFSDIWVQQQGKWRMVAYQATIIAPKPAAKTK